MLDTLEDNNLLTQIQDKLKDELKELPIVIYTLFVLASIDYNVGNIYLVTQKQEYANNILKNTGYKVLFFINYTNLELHIIKNSKIIQKIILTKERIIIDEKIF